MGRVRVVRVTVFDPEVLDRVILYAWFVPMGLVFGAVWGLALLFMSPVLVPALVIRHITRRRAT